VNASLSDLASSFGGAIDQIGEAQGAVGNAREKASEAMGTLGRVSDGSGNELISSALAQVATCDEALEEILSIYASAIDDIRTYMSVKGLA
jgi:hypothetical protein